MLCQQSSLGPAPPGESYPQIGLCHLQVGNVVAGSRNLLQTLPTTNSDILTTKRKERLRSNGYTVKNREQGKCWKKVARCKIRSLSWDRPTPIRFIAYARGAISGLFIANDVKCERTIKMRTRGFAPDTVCTYIMVLVHRPEFEKCGHVALDT